MNRSHRAGMTLLEVLVVLIKGASSPSIVRTDPNFGQ